MHEPHWFFLGYIVDLVYIIIFHITWCRSQLVDSLLQSLVASVTFVINCCHALVDLFLKYIPHKAQFWDGKPSAFLLADYHLMGPIQLFCNGCHFWSTTSFSLKHIWSFPQLIDLILNHNYDHSTSQKEC